MSRAEQGLTLGRLAERLAALAPRLEGDGSTSIGGVAEDSRLVQAGDLFVARAGGTTSGLRHAAEALGRGARALLVERSLAAEVAPLPAGVGVLWVDDARVALGLAAEALAGEPSAALAVVGITGTNGKTTSTALACRALAGVGARPARLGTLGYAFEDDVDEGTLTTPGAAALSGYAARARDAGASHLVMEVSSHALAQRRVDALSFRAAAFTNLTQDHLDYHGTLQEYASAKRRLFAELSPEVAVVNVDDAWGERMLEGFRGRTLRVGRAARADLRPESVVIDARGLRGTVATPSGSVQLDSRLVGEHNLDNLLLVLGLVEALGLDVVGAAAELRGEVSVPGRLERCDGEADDLVVLVDYAHTPDALRRVLQATRPLTEGDLHCVFGCGGDRDPSKRPLMGRAVALAASRAFITNDNPRSESPSAIAAQVEEGFVGTATPHEVVLDRAVAIRRAVLEARPGDLVLIAGKGHERYQVIGAERRAFDDCQVARDALAERRAARTGRVG